MFNNYGSPYCTLTTSHPGVLHVWISNRGSSVQVFHKLPVWVWTSWEWQLSAKWPSRWSAGWALLNRIVCRGICHWSREEIWGRRGLNGGENTWTISRENMRFSLIIVYIVKTWEPNRIDPDSTETPATAPTSQTDWFLPRGQEGNQSRTLFWSSWKPGPEIDLTTGGGN